MTRIIGIDPGTACCGYGIVEPAAGKSNTAPRYIIAGDVKMSSKKPLQDRLKLLYDSLKSVIEEFKPTHLCIEKIFYHKSIRSALTLGSARGIVLLLAAEFELPLYEYNPTELKMALTGYGRAEKSQVQEMVKVILNLNSTGKKFSKDSTDALALCICHLNQLRITNY